MALVGGRYHLFYGAGWWESDGAAIGYANCAGPLGGCTKAPPPAAWMATDATKARPAGPTRFSPDGGATWPVAYHAWSRAGSATPLAAGAPSGSTASTSRQECPWSSSGASAACPTAGGGTFAGRTAVVAE